jgi:hypothetical protein
MEQADFFFPFHSCESVGLRTERCAIPRLKLDEISLGFCLFYFLVMAGLQTRAFLFASSSVPALPLRAPLITHCF